MSLTYVKIASVEITATGGAQTIDFTNIPGHFDDLVLNLSLRGAEGGFEVVSIRPNGLTTNRANRYMYGAGSGTPGSGTSTDNWSSYWNPSSSTASVFSSHTVYFPGYKSSNNKSSSSDAVTEHNGTEAFAWFDSNLWSSSSAITSLTIIGSAGLRNIGRYSTATLYGISRQ